MTVQSASIAGSRWTRQASPAVLGITLTRSILIPRCSGAFSRA